jgi:hypothetical protein
MPQTLELRGRPGNERVNWVWLVLDAPAGAADVQFKCVGPETLKL